MVMTGTLSFMYDAEGKAILALRTDERNEARDVYLQLHGEEVDATFKKHRKKRSLDANAYAWVLMDKLAFATGLPKEEIYRSAIKEIGGNTETVCVLADAADKLCTAWARNGLGWQTETVPSKLGGCVNVILYYGSSTYDTRQMSRLIDGLIEDCRALHIETLPPDKLNSLLEAWDAKS